jgi:hypothetical protein
MKKHNLYSQDKDHEIKVFDSFNKEKIKAEIVKHLDNYPNDTIEHRNGETVINFYVANNGKPSLVVLKGNKEYYKSLSL